VGKRLYRLPTRLNPHDMRKQWAGKKPVLSFAEGTPAHTALLTFCIEQRYNQIISKKVENV
jgi:hypothetical protein